MNFPRFEFADLVSWIRAWPLAAVAVVLLALVILSDIARVDVLIWGLTKVAALGYLGYWIDRWLFPYARAHEFWWPEGDEDPPEDPVTELQDFTPDMDPIGGEIVSSGYIDPTLQIRRAIIIAACILTATLIP
jgi:hypothetical protein